MELKNFNIEWVPVSELNPYKNNPRHNDSAVEAVANSIKSFGFKVPLVIQKDKTIVTGHTRLKAAKKLGIKSVPCIIADDLNEEQIRAFRLVDNKTSELAEWDFSKLEKEIENISFNMEDFGFDFDFEEDEEEYQDERAPYAGYSGEAIQGEENLPEELQGKDLEPEELEKLQGSDNVAKERIIIVYDKNDEEKIKKLLGIDVISKVVYPLEEILNAK